MKCGHLICGVILGLKPEKLNIMPLGLAIYFKENASNYNKKPEGKKLFIAKKTTIAIAGPLTNFILATLFSIFPLKLGNILNTNIIYANILIGIFNLIPIYPLDGGRIVKNIIHIRKGIKKASEYVQVINHITIIILTFMASILLISVKNIAILFIIIYLWYLVIIEYKKYILKKNMYKVIEKQRVI